ncbi:CsbD family protein [Adhaeribacter radiodurans]|nr:CsbD family protein [Adhaeribacter radiodurans]
MMLKVKDKSGKVILAAVAGLSAGIIAGLLMAPEPGRDTISALKNKALDYGDQLDDAVRNLMRKLEGSKVTNTGSSLKMQGTWDEVKGRLKTKYGDLTDEDLTYVEGEEDKFLGNLEFKLGQGKKELRRIIEEI